MKSLRFKALEDSKQSDIHSFTPSFHGIAAFACQAAASPALQSRVPGSLAFDAASVGFTFPKMLAKYKAFNIKKVFMKHLENCTGILQNSLLQFVWVQAGF